MILIQILRYAACCHGNNMLSIKVVSEFSANKSLHACGILQSCDEAGEKSKKSRRSASRRVSFAETCQIK